ncbi:MAG: hypothetical protein KAR80_06030, partial [Rhodospirillaceae bacterium]|nr:hypothetical protein [Rhodospirillaceae bacterium]
KNITITHKKWEYAVLSKKQNNSDSEPDPVRAKDKLAAAGPAEAVFARRLRVLRRVLDISACELDRQIGLGPGTIGRLERGNQRIYASHLYRVGEITGIGIDYFYMGLGDIMSETGSETENIKNDIDYLLNSLEAAKAGDLRGDAKIVARLLATELTKEMATELADELGAEEDG